MRHVSLSSLGIFFLLFFCNFTCNSALPAVVSLQDLVRSGSFESAADPLPYCTNYLNNVYRNCSQGLTALIDPWTFKTPNLTLDIFVVPTANCTDGKRCIDLNSGPDDRSIPTILTQVIPFVVGKTYRLQIDLGSRQCACLNQPSIRNASVSVYGVEDSHTWLAVYGQGNLSCFFQPFQWDFTPSEALETLELRSNLIAPCGPLFDNVRIKWVGCFSPPIDFSDPAFEDAVASCTDEWTVTLPSTPLALTVSTPVTITGDLSVTRLAMTIPTQVTGAAAALVQVNGQVTLDGTLVLDLSEPVTEDRQLVLLNSTEPIQGSFADTQLRVGSKTCKGNKPVVDLSQSTTLLVFMYDSREFIAIGLTRSRSTPCSGKSSRSLKPWHIALIVIGVVILVGVVTAAVLLIDNNRREKIKSLVRTNKVQQHRWSM